MEMESITVQQGRIAALLPADTNEAELYGPLATIKEAVFTGSGLDDLSSGGTYTDAVPEKYTVQIDSIGTPDTFKWSKDGGKTFEAELVSVTGGAQALDAGVTVEFAATTGHTSGDKWEISVQVEEINAILRIVNQDAAEQTYGVAHTDGTGAASGEDWIVPDGKTIEGETPHEASVHLKTGEFIRVKSGAASMVSFHLSGQKIIKEII